MVPGGRGFVAAVVAAQVLTQIGAFTLPALLPGYIERWALSNTEAGWLVGIFFAAHVLAVPVLVALTDRLPPRRIYLVGAGLTALAHLGFALVADGFWSGLILRAAAGIGWAGAYMPGLKVLADHLEGPAQSRAVSWHAAGVGIAGSLSFAAAGLLDALAGPRAAFLFGGTTALVACAIAAVAMPRRPIAVAPAPRRGLLDFRPVFRNRRAMAWIVGYTAHTWELAAIRAWAVTFLAAMVPLGASPAWLAPWLPGPTALYTAAGLLGIAVSVTGNETAARRGRARVVRWAMLASATLALLTGWTSGLYLPLTLLLVLLWNAAVFLDSSALTGGTVQAAEPALRGATMGLHGMAGYLGGFIGPLGVGLMLDLCGDGRLGWGLAFGHLAVIGLIGLAVMRRLQRE